MRPAIVTRANAFRIAVAAMAILVLLSPAVVDFFAWYPGLLYSAVLACFLADGRIVRGLLFVALVTPGSFLVVLLGVYLTGTDGPLHSGNVPLMFGSATAICGALGAAYLGVVLRYVYRLRQWRWRHAVILGIVGAVSEALAVALDAAAQLGLMMPLLMGLWWVLVSEALIRLKLLFAD